ncbi:LAFE_0G00980g1_1 [Lachancea fermentati]|uniref:LAFE_0G00980g1_1 n=1 Tax=Lachancea fermentati TaxID=4955 RepID=A0A1G4MGP8_LACFM|nr:LAFE_0G00980g1_1 [Lachancea fermentati]
MGLYLPPGGSKSPNASKLGRKEDPDDANEEGTKFYVRPSLGLRLWGPLVPASDNRKGLWTLVAIQTGLGLLCMKRFRSIGAKVIKRDIADFPSLNRFSTTHGNMYVTKHGATTFGGTHSFRRQAGEKTGFFNSPKITALRRTLYLLSGTLLLSQSLLETCRLTLLKYDPWYEEARSVRDKQFFNDIIKFYHEGVDPTKFKVKDASNGTVLPLNIPEVKQSVAVARATAQADNFIVEWFGPLEYKPMSFSDFLDRLEYHIDMSDFLRNKQTQEVAAELLGKKISHGQSELEELVERNTKNRERIFALLLAAPKNSIPQATASHHVESKGVLLDPDCRSPEDINLDEIWSTFNPWMDLALETSLSIKFLPTVLMPEDTKDGKQSIVDSENDGNDTEPSRN